MPKVKTVLFHVKSGKFVAPQLQSMRPFSQSQKTLLLQVSHSPAAYDLASCPKVSMESEGRKAMVVVAEGEAHWSFDSHVTNLTR